MVVFVSTMVTNLRISSEDNRLLHVQLMKETTWCHLWNLVITCGHVKKYLFLQLIFHFKEAKLKKQFDKEQKIALSWNFPLSFSTTQLDVTVFFHWKLLLPKPAEIVFSKQFSCSCLPWLNQYLKIWSKWVQDCSCGFSKQLPKLS